MPRIKLIEIAFARSGDKNNMCNIGVCARKPAYFPILQQYLSPEIVKAHMGGLVKGRIEKFEWEAIESVNFLCYEALDGGGGKSMRMDSLGKNFASHLLRLELDLPDDWAEQFS